MNHGHTRTHKTHHDLNLGEATTFPLMVFSVINHGGCIQMSFCFGTPKLGVLKLQKLGLLKFWKVITSYTYLQLEWSLYQSCSLCWKLSNDIWHVICTHVFQGDFWLLGSWVKLALWLTTLLLTITCVLSTQMGHASPFKTSMFQEISNGLRNFLMQWVLTPEISFWRFEIP